MKEYLKKYSDSNPEKFNKDFILSRNKQDILEYAKDIFKSLEILDEIEVEEVTIQKDESNFAPIIIDDRYYKSILPSRLDKIHYKIRITPNEDVRMEPINFGKQQVKKSLPANDQSIIIEKDIFINKLIDNCFYINEGVRYFLIYQIVDNATYGTKNTVSLKSLLMPITLKQEDIVATPVYSSEGIELKSYTSLLFSKAVNPILYILAKDSYNSLVTLGDKDDDYYTKWADYKDPTIIDKFNEFFKTDIQFADSLTKFEENNERMIFELKPEKTPNDGLYISVGIKELEEDNLTRAVVGCLLNITGENKKKRIIFSYNQLITPWFWIDTLSSFFTKNSDTLKKFNKIRTMLISLNRLMDDSCRKILALPDEDKESTLTILRYIMKNFQELMVADSKDLDNKRLRLYEYQLYPLRLYLSNQIYRVLNSPTHSRNVLERIFNNLQPMSIIKQTVTNELLRYYNSTNEVNLFSALLKETMRGPQSLNKTVTMEQRDLHPSYTGRLSLIASSASDPGLSGNLSPFVEIYDYYFKKQN